MRLVGKGDQFGRNVIGAGHDQTGRDALLDLPERAGALFRTQVAQIIEFGFAEYLHPIRVNQVEMADESVVGSVNLVAVDDAVAALRTANATELQPLLLVFEQLPDVNLAHGDLMTCCSSRKTTDECWRHLRRRAGDCGTACR